MNAAEIRLSVLNILADIMPDEDFTGLKDDISFREQLSMDSMDVLDIILELRKRYKVHIPEEDFPKLDTLDSSVAYLLAKM